jgi:hypothetical protein
MVSGDMRHPCDATLPERAARRHAILKEGLTQLAAGRLARREFHGSAAERRPRPVEQQAGSVLAETGIVITVEERALFGDLEPRAGAGRRELDGRCQRLPSPGADVRGQSPSAVMGQGAAIGR